MRILLCDDNPAILEQLRSYLREFFRSMHGPVPEYAIYSSGDALLENETKADIAFLDVEMPGVSGISVGAKLKKHNPKIKIFIITAYPDYLDEAMRFQVFRYLSKPIEKNRLFRNMKDAMFLYHMESEQIPIVTTQGISLQKTDDILCVEATQRKLLIHTTEDTFCCTQTIDEWRKKLSLPCFYSSHRSYIINMAFVSIIEKDRILLKCETKEIYAYLTRRKYSHFKDTYLNYLESVKL